MFQQVTMSILSGLCVLFIISGAQGLTFTLPSYSRMVTENDIPPDGFLQVTCISTTTGEPIDTVEYSIATGVQAPFEINPTNGQLSLTDGQILDYETAESYTFTVVCTDTSNATITATATVVVAIDPVNEFDPVPSTSTLTLIIPENTPIGTIIVSTQPGGMRSYFVTDEDGGPNGVISYTLLANQTDAATFSLDQTTGALVLVQSLDVDNIQGGLGRISVRILACDEHPPRSDCPTISVFLVILSANDNNPVFSADVYEVRLPESSPVGTIVATPECTDGDVGAGQYRGIQIGTDDSNFHIPNQANGTVELSELLDFEVNRMHNVTLICSDTGGRTTTAQLIVNVLPVNNKPPRFNQSTYNLTVNRLNLLSSDIGRVFASDDDESVGNTLSFSLEGDTENFNIKDDGTITLEDFIFALEGNSFILSVTVDDGLFNDTSVVTITVDGLVSIPEIVVIAIGGLLFLVLLCLLFLCICCCCVYCGRRLRKKKPTESTDNLNKPIPGHDMVPMMHQDFYAHVPAQPYMVYQIPTDDRKWPHSQNESYGSEEPDLGSVSHDSNSTSKAIGPVLQEMVEYFHEGDKIITKNKK